jgi:hypothetical protein
MRRLALVALLALAATAAACGNKKKPTTDALPADEVTPDDMLREQKRIAAGELVGQALMAPRIELDYRGVTVNGRLVASPSDLDATKLARVAKLFAWLKGLKEHWRAIHPGEDFHGLVELDAAPESDALVGESVIETAAMAGFPRVRFKIDEIAWDAMLTVPRPPLDDAPDPKPDARLRLRRALVGWEIDVLVPGPCDRRPTVKTRVVKSDVLAAMVDEVCPTGERCFLSVEASEGALLTVAKLVAPAFGPGRPTNVSLDFFASEEASGSLDGGAAGGSFVNPWGNDSPFTLPDPTASPAPSPSAAAPNKPGKVRTGAVLVSGYLALEAVDKVVQTKLDAVRACYDDGRRRTPLLQGRVTVKLAIDASGSVAQACNGGSDLPSYPVVTCIVSATSKLTFPAPESGAVTIVVPFMLSPP